MKRIKEIAETGVCYGYRRIHVLLPREGWRVSFIAKHRGIWAVDLDVRGARCLAGRLRWLADTATQ